MSADLTPSEEEAFLRAQAHTLPSFASANYEAFCALRLRQADEALARDEIPQAGHLLNEYAIAAIVGHVPETSQCLEVVQQWIAKSTALVWDKAEELAVGET